MNLSSKVNLPRENQLSGLSKANWPRYTLKFDSNETLVVHRVAAHRAEEAAILGGKFLTTFLQITITIIPNVR